MPRPRALALLALGAAAIAAPSCSHALRQHESALLDGRSLAIAYSGYRAGHHPDPALGGQPTDAELLEDLRILARDDRFTLIRLYDAGELSERVLRLVAAHGLPHRVLLGAWLEAEVSNHEGCPWLTEPIPAEKLAANTARNREEIARVIRLANAYPRLVVAVNVGNEALVSWNDHMVPLEALVAYVREVKAAIAQPVSTADNYVVWVEQGPALAEAVDFAMVHTYPVWEGKGIDEAMAFTRENMRAVRKALPDARLVIGEAGWPDVASEFPDAANEANQERYIDELVAWAAEARITTFVFEAFDEPWKGDPADPLGAEKHWGLFTVERRPKQVVRHLYPDLAEPAP